MKLDEKGWHWEPGWDTVCRLCGDILEGEVFLVFVWNDIGHHRMQLSTFQSHGTMSTQVFARLVIYNTMEKRNAHIPATSPKKTYLQQGHTPSRCEGVKGRRAVSMLPDIFSDSQWNTHFFRITSPPGHFQLSKQAGTEAYMFTSQSLHLQRLSTHNFCWFPVLLMRSRVKLAVTEATALSVYDGGTLRSGKKQRQWRPTTRLLSQSGYAGSRTFANLKNFSTFIVDLTTFSF